MVQSYDSKGNERKQRKELVGKMVGKGKGTTRQACSPVLSYAFRQRLSIRCGF
jgi:hypothetical protein